MTDETMSEYLVMCRTKGCTNNGIAITVISPSDPPNVQCGACGTSITSVRKL